MQKRSTSYYGWIIVGASFITLALAYGVMYSFSVFFVALLKEFAWNRSACAGAFSIFHIISSLIGPVVGGVVISIGPKRIIVLGSLILGGGLALCSLTQSWWQFYLFFGVITAVGVGTTGWVPNVTLIQYWFKEKRGLAIGIMSAGIGIGILVCVPSIQYWITKVGWRMTYRIMALFIPFVVISLAIAFLKNRPEAISSSATEQRITPAATKDPLSIDETWTSQSWTIRRAIATKQFWLLAVVFFSGNIITQSVFTHQVAFFVDHHMEALLASFLVGVVGIVSIGGKILWGVLSDKIGREITYTLGMTCSVFGMIALILFNYFEFTGLAYFFSLSFGLGYAVTAALPPLIIADFFEGHGYGSIFGTLMIFLGMGGAFGAWFSGFVYDQVGSYVPVFLVLMFCGLLACYNLWRAAPRKIRRVPGRVRTR